LRSKDILKNFAPFCLSGKAQNFALKKVKKAIIRIKDTENIINSGV